MPWLALAMAGASALSEQKKQDDQRRQRSVDLRYSPWVKTDPQAITSGGALSGAIQGGAAGLAQSQNMKNSDSWQQWMQQHGSPDKQANQFPGVPSGEAGSLSGGAEYGPGANDFGNGSAGGLSHGQQFGPPQFNSWSAMRNPGRPY